MFRLHRFTARRAGQCGPPAALPVTVASTGETCSSVDLNNARRSAMVHSAVQLARLSVRPRDTRLITGEHVTGLRHS
jgi:hypothetical protein